MRKYFQLILILGLGCRLSGFLLACGGASTNDGNDTLDPDGKADHGNSNPRDWNLYPAIEVLPKQDTIYAISDIHGGYDRAVKLLVANQILEEVPYVPSDARWAAGQATLIVAGDMIDKGEQSVEVIELMAALQRDAQTAGGRVIVLLGNHEAEFLADPKNDNAKASDGIDAELEDLGITPKQFAAGDHGVWLRTLPFGVQIGALFFCHSGDTQGLSLDELDKSLRHGLDKHGWDADEIIGDKSILESFQWFGSGSSKAAKYAKAIGVDHIVFGHDPGALGPKGAIVVGPDAVLFRIDTGLSPNIDYSQGYLARIDFDGPIPTLQALDHKGRVAQIW